MAAESHRIGGEHARHGHAPAPAPGPTHEHEHAHAHGHEHGRGHGHGHRHDHGHDRGHAHGLGHGHGHDHAPASFDRAFAVGTALNAAFVAIEAYWGWRTGSLALLADAGHNLGDVAGLLLAWAAAWAARRPPGPRRTYGLKRATIVAAAANAVLLLIAMGALALEALERLRAPPPVAGTTVMVVAAVGIAVNAATAMLFARGRHADLNVRGAYLHMLGDALVSAGVVVAGALAWAFGWARVDPVASLVVAAIVVAASWGLMRRSLHLLFDGVPDGIALDAVRAELARDARVHAVLDLHVWAIGTTETALTAHLLMPGGADDAFLAGSAARLRERFGIGHVTLQPMRQPCAAGGCDAAAVRGAHGAPPGQPAPPA